MRTDSPHKLIVLNRMNPSILLLVTLPFILFSFKSTLAQDFVRASTLPDLSGLSWIEGDLFLGIHDAKRNKEKKDWPRVSLIHLPKSELHGVTWQTLDLNFPGPPGRSSDMESACKLPDGKGFLFAESGQEGKADRRIFYATYSDGKLQIKSYIVWPVDIKNVESTEVCQVGDQLVFLYAERADSLPETKIRWATLSLNPFQLGKFNEITYKAVDPIGQGARPIVALDVDSDGLLYIVTAQDPGSDDGPYRSVVWQIGKIDKNSEDKPEVTLSPGNRIANLDSLKVESIAIRELIKGQKQIFIGTDDEHYGGIIRPLPSQ